MKKRILIFSTAYFPLVGGAEVAVKEITDRLSDFEFVMITARLDSKLPLVEKIGNIEVHRLGKGNNRDKYRLIWQGARYARKLGHFDALWSIMASYAGFSALRLKKAKNTPFLLTLQEGDSRWDIYKHVWWCWPYFKQIFKRADRIQAISNYLAEWAKNMGAKCPIEVVPNGVNSNLFQSLAISSRHLGKNVITTSRLVKKNGLSDLIQAMVYLSPEIKLKIIGSGSLQGRLKQQVKKLSLGDRVKFLGEKNHQEIFLELKNSDVFCRPSLSEGLGNSFLEAMAVGVPIVGANVGGIPDFLKDGETGLFCANNPKDIAEKIKRILDNQELRESLIVNGKKMVEQNYSWNMIAEKMKNIFNNLCAS